MNRYEWSKKQKEVITSFFTGKINQEGLLEEFKQAMKTLKKVMLKEKEDLPYKLDQEKSL